MDQIAGLLERPGDPAHPAGFECPLLTRDRAMVRRLKEITITNTLLPTAAQTGVRLDERPRE